MKLHSTQCNAGYRFWLVSGLIVFQANPLYLGLPPSPLPRLLRVLLLQRDAGGPPLSAHILGLPHSLHDQEVYVWNGKYSMLFTHIRSGISVQHLLYHIWLVIWGKLAIRDLAQEHVGTRNRGDWDRINLLVSCQSTLPPEPQPPFCGSSVINQDFQILFFGFAWQCGLVRAT